MSSKNARIKNLVFYPVKSAAGIDLQTAALTEEGLEVGLYADHQFMIVRAQADERGVHHFVTQRDMRSKRDTPQGLSAMALIKPQLVDDALRLTWNYQDPISLPPDHDHGLEIPVKVWEHEGYAVDQGGRISEWLSGHLDLPVRLVKAAGSFNRKARQNYAPNKNPLRFQDGYPIHWFPIESVEELSDIAGQEIPWRSFRPQVVMEGMPPQYEHKILSGEIAGIPYSDPKPCERCPMTLVDQETGRVRELTTVTAPGGRTLTVQEPLFSLSRYKKWRNIHGEVKVLFGENMLPLGMGRVTLGDELVVTSYREPALVYGAKV